MSTLRLLVLAFLCRAAGAKQPAPSWVIHVPDAAGLVDARALAADLGFAVIAPELFKG